MKTTLSFFPSHNLGWKNVVMIIIIGLLHDLKVMNNYVTFPNNIIIWQTGNENTYQVEAVILI